MVALNGGLCHQPTRIISQQGDATPGLHISCAGRGPGDQNVNTCHFYQVLFMQGLSSRSLPNIYLNRVSLQTVPWPWPSDWRARIITRHKNNTWPPPKPPRRAGWGDKIPGGEEEEIWSLEGHYHLIRTRSQPQQCPTLLHQFLSPSLRNLHNSLTFSKEDEKQCIFKLLSNTIYTSCPHRVQPSTPKLKAVYGHSLIINPSLGAYQEIQVDHIKIKTSLLLNEKRNDKYIWNYWAKISNYISSSWFCIFCSWWCFMWTRYW